MSRGPRPRSEGSGLPSPGAPAGRGAGEPRDLEEAVALAAGVRGAFGAVLCDFEGEAVVARLGATQLPPRILEEARRHVPESLATPIAPAEFLLRLAGAEPCALLALFERRGRALGVGGLEALEIGYARVGLLALRLPEDYYLVVVLDRRSAGGFGLARQVARRIHPVLVREIAG